MIDTAAHLIVNGLLLGFGLFLSCSFASVRPTKKNIILLSALFILCAGLQITIYSLCGEITVRRLYPLITHLPIILFLCLYFRRRIFTALASVVTAYLCCQPAKWLGVLAEALTESQLVCYITHGISLIATGVIFIFFLSTSVSELYSSKHRSVLFGFIPMLYYLFDYAVGVYTELWINFARAAIEFPPVFLCFSHLIFCIVYYKEHKKIAVAERKEQIILITAEQQAKELESLKRNERELRFVRHDLNLLLNNLHQCLEEGDTDTAKKIIAGFSSRIESTCVHAYCGNTIINYILSDCATKCRESEIDFSATVMLSELSVDEIMFSSILSNALDNALKAQKDLPKNRRSIQLLLKHTDNKLLLSVRNTFKDKPVLADGIPVSTKRGHGYGTQSIRYITETLGGNCQFTIDDQDFVLRVVI